MASAKRRGESPAAVGASAGSPAARSPRELLLVHAALLRSLFAFIAQGHALTAEEARAFETFARRRLADDDHAIVREFRGRSTFATYLTVVVHRMFIAYAAAADGKPPRQGRLISQEGPRSDD